MAGYLDCCDNDNELTRVNDRPVQHIKQFKTREGPDRNSRVHAGGWAEVHWLQWGMLHAMAANLIRTDQDAQIPRTINMLNAFRAELPSTIASSLNTQPTRFPDSSNIESINTRGRALWDAIYRPLQTKLEEKLGEAHPDLPVFIINNEYGGLFTDPARNTGATVGRVTTSLIAITCLRAQQGVGPQVLSHVFGLRKGWDDGTWKQEPEAGEEEGIKWLVSDEGCTWILEKVDELVEALGGGHGSTFAPVKSKL